jgi:hypothetical protein
MLETVKRLVGADREAPASPQRMPALDLEALERPIEAARKLLDAATRDHSAAMERVAEVGERIKAAEADFDRDGADKQADRLLELRRELERRQLFSQRTQRAAVAAAGAVEDAQAVRDRTVLQHLDDRRQKVAERLEALWGAGGREAFQRVAALLRDAQAIIDDAEQAAVEAASIRGRNPRPDVEGIRSQMVVIYVAIGNALELRDRTRIERAVR